MSPSYRSTPELLQASVLLDALVEGVLLIDPESRVVLINRPLERLLGIDRDAFQGNDTDQFVHRGLAPSITDEACREQIVQSLREPADPASLACTIHSAGGTERRYLISSTVMPDEPFGGMRLVRFQETPGWTQAAETLRKSEERFHALIAASARVLFRMSPNWSEMQQLQGGTCIENTDEPNRNWLQEYVHPDDRKRVLGAIERAVQTGTVFEQEHRFLRADGTAGWTASQAVPVRNAAGEIVEWFGAASVITERKQAEEALRKAYAELDERVRERTAELTRSNSRLQVEIEERKRSEDALRESRAKLEAALASMTDAVFISDVEGRFVEFNDAFATFHRFRNKDECYRTMIEYQDYIDMYYPDGTLRPLDMWSVPRALRGETAMSAEFTLRRKDTGETWIGSYNFAPIRNKDGVVVGAVITARDITEQKQAEEALIRHAEELTRLHHDLEAANREANLYLDILTHDIRNTENVSNLYAELLVDILDGETARYAENLQRSIKKSIEILGTVSTIRRIHRGSPDLEPMDLDAAVREVIEVFPGSTFVYNGAHHQVRADNLLSVIFNNLIGNAVKHGGPEVVVAIRVEEEDGFVHVSIEDTGRGIPDDEKDAVFHRYEQKKRGVGEGLGLYLVQILVERYGGRVWVEDRVPGHPGEGAAFKFTLKRAA